MRLASATTLLLACTLILQISAAGLSAAPLQAKPRPTNAQLKAIKNDATKYYDTNRPSRRIATRPGKNDLTSRSTILSDGKTWTMVPRGAVLNIPSRLANRVNRKPTGTLVSWSQFLRNNRGWLQVKPVEMSQARGESPFSTESLVALEQSNRVVVAVYHSGPISVMKAPAPNDSKPLHRPERAIAAR